MANAPMGFLGVLEMTGVSTDFQGTVYTADVPTA